MLLLTNGVQGHIIVTLNEKKTLSESDYTLTFTNIATKETVAFTLASGDDLSAFPDRYNEYLVTVTGTAGQWNYEIKENTTEEIIEIGRMYLVSTATITTNTHDATILIKGYGG